MEDLAALWEEYALSGRAHANLLEQRGDSFGATLRLARAEVREAAAKLLRESADPSEAAKIMHDNVRQFLVRDFPLAGFDPVAIDYTKARTWQDCARAVDPTLPEIQPRIDG